MANAIKCDTILSITGYEITQSLWQRLMKGKITGIIAEIGYNHKGDMEIAREMTI